MLLNNLFDQVDNDNNPKDVNLEFKYNKFSFYNKYDQVNLENEIVLKDFEFWSGSKDNYLN